jgi:hypothetical protein
MAKGYTNDDVYEFLTEELSKKLTLGCKKILHS